MLLQLLLWLLPLFPIIILIRNYFLLPTSVPGPFIARFSNVYRAWLVWGRRAHEVQLDLHRKYGDVVRLGPDNISVSGPGYLSIYAIGKGFIKSDFYRVFQNIVNGKRAASLVAMTDESEHSKTKRLVAHAYSLSTLVEFEPLVDSTTSVFLDTLEKRFAATGATCNLGEYLQFYAFDVIGELTFSKRLGFIETGEDAEGILSSIGSNFSYFSVLGQIPWLDEWLGKNPLYIKYLARPVASPIIQFGQKLLSERLAEQQQGKVESNAHPDFLSRFLQIRKETEEPMTDRQILSFLFMNINAGSDTIASTVRAVFYHLLRNPSSLSELVSELDEAKAQNKLTTPCPSWHETQSLPYLCAAIKEGLRMNPALSLPLERVVPPEGFTLQDPQNTYLPKGSIIGINPYVFHRDPRVFGSDADQWNPARWLSEQEKESRTMDHSLLQFGAGKRSCLGKNIAMLELHKLVAAILLKFRLELADPAKEWVVKNAWVLNQTGLEVKVAVR
ncbi:cytochrome P450 oxidoreductase [Rhizodiscina lignyota]|uniref:Cytochrome P450 oxidoreductase n=1 Tax=Rhizodiscina lignyota TaxID=1504668 RepID=A0A9P4IRL8_9PEZI|nr:cytochrome P450 oxidoreductase [Rhizodiscina lignyota]